MDHKTGFGLSPGQNQKICRLAPKFNLMYSQYIQVRKLFKGGNYLRKYGIQVASYSIQVASYRIQVASYSIQVSAEIIQGRKLFKGGNY